MSATTASLTSAELATEVTTTLAALRTAHAALDDENLSTSQAYEANFARRSTLNAYIGRLRMEHQRLRELEPNAVMLLDWLETLCACQRDFRARLLEKDASVTGGLSASTEADMLRMALRDIDLGPDVVSSGECLTNDLVEWFKDHDITPLPEERGFFSGRGGLRAAEERLATVTTHIAQARADVEYTLAAANASI